MVVKQQRSAIYYFIISYFKYFIYKSFNKNVNIFLFYLIIQFQDKLEQEREKEKLIIQIVLV